MIIIIKQEGDKNGMTKSLLLGFILSVSDFVICIGTYINQGIAYAMSFAAMLLVGVVVVT